MGIVEYRKGDHASGFIGFRVTRTICGSDDNRQRYYPLSRYTRHEAESRAISQDKEWAKEATKMLRKRKITGTVWKTKPGPNALANGLVAWIDVYKKVRGGELRTYFTVAFFVKKIGYGHGYLRFNIRRLGYDNAWKLAVREYAKIHGLSDYQARIVRANKPDKSLFYGYLLRRVRKQGHTLSLAKLRGFMGDVEKQH